MSIYTYVRNLDPKEGFDRVTVRADGSGNPTLILKKGEYADLTASEIQRLSTFIELVPGQVGSPATVVATPSDGQIGYAERIAGWSAFASDQSYVNIDGLTIEFTLDTAADVMIRAGGFNGQILTAGNKIRIAVLVDGVRKMNAQAGGSAFNASQTQQWIGFPLLERTLRLGAGLHYLQVAAMHQTQASANTASAEALWGDMTNFNGGANEEGAMTLQAFLT